MISSPVLLLLMTCPRIVARCIRKILGEFYSVTFTKDDTSLRHNSSCMVSLLTVRIYEILQTFDC